MSDKQGRGKKRPKSYYLKCAHKKVQHGNSLDTDMRGFLVTCNGNEKQAVREMYNLLNEYADNLYGPEETTSAAEQKDSDNSDSEDEDLEAAMKKEVDAIKQVKTKERRFQNTNTKSRNTIFIKTILEDPSTLAHTILSDICASGVQKSRYAIRMLPIAEICKARLDDMEACGKVLFKKYFETPFGSGLSYTTVFTRRNNNEISREAVIPKLGHIVKDFNPLHRVNHVNPDYVILVEIIGKLCCMSVVKDFFKFKKYNLIEVSKIKAIATADKTNKSNTEGDPPCAENEEEVAKTSDDSKTVKDEGPDVCNPTETCSTLEETAKLETNDTLNIENLETYPEIEDCNAETAKQEETSCKNLSRKRKGESLSRESTVVMENVGKGDYPDLLKTHTVVMKDLIRSETVVMESLPKSETIIMKSMERKESVMDALSKGESVMDMGTTSESVMEVLTTKESVMDSF
ncbi:THUMP domain-containing protein 1-like [Mytilus californianus]|uniref:THUMP domain-containing protein 1-like n=1 Tax=Mytilus californianus TaxID=6549 RepID=UPI0022465E15|nr:THUMP domain-containing protein 1-like [Mytilus californianus]XP_052067861.1 THUMP domain-containing protein 1-like [Mytilus californianus]XP_052067862.1 THUMP domain-containing protein 1-like [Mytilus californianus]